MKSILVIDEMPIVREPLAVCLGIEGYTVHCASNGAEGLAELRAHRPDLVLLDLVMPVLDGISFLRAMRRDPLFAKTPVILITATCDKTKVIEAAKLGVRDFFFKSRFSLKELTARIKLRLADPKTVAAVTAISNEKNASGSMPAGHLVLAQEKGPAITLDEIKPLLTAPQCKSRVEASLAGKTLSGAVAEVMMLAGRPSTELKDLAGLITRDPVLSVRVLQMANSAAFASRRGSVNTMPEAVRNIGATNVRNIAASVGIFDAMPASSPDGFNPIRCWQHSFAVARLCEAFTSPSAPAEAGVAYLVGLCHDLGEIMFRTQFENEYQSVVDLHTKTGEAIEDVETKLLGMTHNDILSIILKCIGLPETIRSPIERFQKTSKLSADQPVLLRALGMAETYSNGLMLASSESSLISPFTERQWAALVGQGGRVQLPDGEEIRAQVQCLSAILSRMNSSDQAKLMESPFKKNESRIWLAKEAWFAKADPLLEALRLLANVEVCDHLPGPVEITGYSAVVVESKGKNVLGWNEPAIEACRKSGGANRPALWIVSDPLLEPSEGGLTPVRSVTVQSLQGFVDCAIPVRELAIAA